MCHTASRPLTQYTALGVRGKPFYCNSLRISSLHSFSDSKLKHIYIAHYKLRLDPPLSRTWKISMFGSYNVIKVIITNSCPSIDNGVIVFPHTSLNGTLPHTKGSGHVGYGDFIINKILELLPWSLEPRTLYRSRLVCYCRVEKCQFRSTSDNIGFKEAERFAMYQTLACCQQVEPNG